MKVVFKFNVCFDKLFWLLIVHKNHQQQLNTLSWHFRSPRTSTSCVSCEPGISTWTKPGRFCASPWPGGSSTRWTTCWKPGAHHKSSRITTPGVGTIMTEVNFHLHLHSSNTVEQENMLRAHSWFMKAISELAILAAVSRGRSQPSSFLQTRVTHSRS